MNWKSRLSWRVINSSLPVRWSSSLAPETSTLLPQYSALLDRLLKGDRVALSRTITLIESTRYDHQVQAELILNRILEIRREQRSSSSKSSAASMNEDLCVPMQNGQPQKMLPYVDTVGSSFRIGISGPPGAGKSSLIEVLGKHIISTGLRVGVIAIDPSSRRTGGSILGDKSRMNGLATLEDAFVRPSPTRGVLGGIASGTHDVVLLGESAGFPVTLVETVGLGQSETDVDACVDMTWVIVPPGGGDELQGIKKGIMEVADAIIVNKADGTLLPAARGIAAEYQRSLKLRTPKDIYDAYPKIYNPTNRSRAIQQETEKKIYSKWDPPVKMCSAAEGTGIKELWDMALEFRRIQAEEGFLAQKRKVQLAQSTWRDFDTLLLSVSKRDTRTINVFEELENNLAAGLITPRKVASLMLDAFHSR